MSRREFLGGAEILLPVSVADQGHRSGAAMTILAFEGAPEKRLWTSHDGKEITGDRSHHRACWRISAGDRLEPGSVLRHALQRMRLFPDIRKIGVGKAHALTRRA